jgi:hypothetical protein
MSVVHTHVGSVEAFVVVQLFRVAKHSDCDSHSWHCLLLVNALIRLTLQRWLIAAGKLPLPAQIANSSNKPFVHDAKALFLFGGGPRMCPGSGLAMVMVKVRCSTH